MQIIIVTGLSGSGKSVALRALEDSGFYCIDNLPATLLPQISHHLAAADQEKIAISIDGRSAALEALPNAMETLRAGGHQVNSIFLDSNTETLVKRFSETRRKHPLSNETTTLAESIQREREMLGNLVTLGHHIDTSNLGSNALRQYIKMMVQAPDHGLTLLFTSFGFKHGIPLDADFVFDIRSLPNPHYDPTLRPLTGKDLAVQQFLQNTPEANEMLADIRHLLEKWLPGFIRDNRSYLTVAIGCTGGQHRSVYFVESLSTYFKAHHHQVLIRHRELIE